MGPMRSEGSRLDLAALAGSGQAEPSAPPRVADVDRPPFGLVVASRAAALFLFAALVWVGGGEGHGAASAVLVGAAVIQPLVAATVARVGVGRIGFVVHDLVLTALVAVLASGYFWFATIAIVSLMATHAIALPTSRYVPVAVAVPLLVAVVGAVADVAYFERAAGIAAVLALAHGIVGRQTRMEIESTQSDLQFAIDAAGGLTHVTRLNVGLIDIGGDVENVVGWPRDEWMTMDQFRVVHPDDQDEFWVDADTVVTGQVIDRTGRIRTKDGRWIWIRDVSRVVETDGHLELRGFTIDFTAQQIGMDRVLAEATTDPLTGLANRRALNAELSRLSDTAEHHLVLIDLNRFKEVNDTLGHEAGDALLRVVGDRIAAAMSETDFLARLGGDEFAIIHRVEVDSHVVAERLESLALGLAQPMEINGVNVTTSVSAGIVRARPSHADRSTMLRYADMAMYTAKRRRVTSIVFDSRMGAQLEQRLMLSTQLADALSTGEIVLHYQPIVDATSGEIAGAEGLARWEHPRLGLLSPAVFLDLILVSERSGDFIRCMVEQAIGAVADLDRVGSVIPVAVNVPVRSIEDGDFERWFVDTCGRAAVSPDRIVFEVAERDLHDGVATVEAIDRLSDIGVGIAVDDFGTGHATFDRLRWRNVSQLKLDRDIIRNAATDRRDGIIVRSIVDLAHGLGYAVVAEGVEDLEQLDMLRSLGCELIQGYLFSPAVPLSEFVDLARAGRMVPGTASYPVPATMSAASPAEQIVARAD